MNNLQNELVETLNGLQSKLDSSLELSENDKLVLLLAALLEEGN